MKITVDVNERLIQDVQQKLGSFQKKAPNAIANALNRAASTVNTNIGKEVRKQYVIKAGDVKATIVKTRATRALLGATVRSTGQLIPLDRFKVSPKTVQPKRKKPIKVSVKKGSLKEVMGAFVADISGTKIFKRSGENRLPIRRLFGPSVPQMLSNEEIRMTIDKEGSQTFYKRLDHEINRILEKGGVSNS
ncbi:phage tail protein [Mesobacillus thioparans]|uniref:phage tail protein n=1 Tax=Mesobacillus thioparans TaxID=370439 RepID=UPI0039EDF7A5